jgi:hypothetical protein
VGDKVMTDAGECVVVSTDWLKRKAMIATLDNVEKGMEISFEILSIKNE